MEGKKEEGMWEGEREDTLFTLHAVTHIHINTPVLTGDYLTVSDGLMPLTGRTQVYTSRLLCVRPHQPSGQAKLCKEDSQQWKLGSQRVADKTEKQVGTWIQNSGRKR